MTSKLATRVGWGLTLTLLGLLPGHLSPPMGPPQVGGLCDPQTPVALASDGQLLSCRTDPGWRRWRP